MTIVPIISSPEIKFCSHKPWNCSIEARYELSFYSGCNKWQTDLHASTKLLLRLKGANSQRELSSVHTFGKYEYEYPITLRWSEWAIWSLFHFLQITQHFLCRFPVIYSWITLVPAHLILTTKLMSGLVKFVHTSTFQQ